MYSIEDLKILAGSRVSSKDILYKDGDNYKLSPHSLGYKFSKNLYLRELDKLKKSQSAEFVFFNSLQTTENFNLESFDKDLFNFFISVCKPKKYPIITNYIYTKNNKIKSYSLWNKCCFLINIFINNNYTISKNKLDGKEFEEFKSFVLNYKNLSQKVLKEVKTLPSIRFSVIYIFKFYLGIPFKEKTPKTILKFTRQYLNCGKLFLKKNSMSLLKTEENFFKSPEEVPCLRLLKKKNNYLEFVFYFSCYGDKTFEEDEADYFVKKISFFLKEVRLNTQDYLKTGEVISVYMKYNEPYSLYFNFVLNDYCENLQEKDILKIMEYLTIGLSDSISEVLFLKEDFLSQNNTVLKKLQEKLKNYELEDLGNLSFYDENLIKIK